MQTMTLLWIVWAVIAAVALGLTLYRAMLTRYEQDQLFLDDAILTEEHHRQELVLDRIHKINPYIMIAGGAASIMLIGMIGTYTWQAWQLLR